MGFLSRKAASKRKLTPLIGAVITREIDTWSVTWDNDGPQPGELRAQTLTEAANQAAGAIVARQAAHPLGQDAELQLAIYPWDYVDGPMFDITAGPSGFSATDMLGIARAPLQGSSLEDLVFAAGNLPDRRAAGAMLMWTRPVAELSQPPA